ncbi:MAG: hypothetical protein ABEJ36_02775 [Candidatus Nanosalina sp.]
MSNIIDFLANIVKTSEETKNEIEREREEIDKRELKEMQQVETEWGDSISEAISKIEQEVQKKDRLLEAAVSDLSDIEEDVERMEEDEEIPRDLQNAIDMAEERADFENYDYEAPSDEEKAQMYAQYVDDLRDKLEDAVENLEEAEQVEEEIEGLIEQAEHSFKNLIQRIEEVHQAEERAERVNADADAHLMELKTKSDKLNELKRSLNKARGNRPGMDT